MHEMAQGSTSLYNWRNTAILWHYLAVGFLFAVVTGVEFSEFMGVMAVDSHVYASCVAGGCIAMGSQVCVWLSQ